MRKRQPFQLKLLLIIYNFSMVVYSVYTVKEVGHTTTQLLISKGAVHELEFENVAVMQI